jgi:hypothetical protein
VQPLEIWQLLLRSGQTLTRALRSQPAALLDALELLHRGEGRTRSGHDQHRACAGYQQLVVVGGRASAELDPLLADGPTPFLRLADPFVGQAGGLWLAARAGFDGASTLVLDLGGTSIKVGYAGVHERLERDPEALPIGPAARGRLDQRERLCEFMATAIIAAIGEREPPRALVFGLAAELDDAGVPGRSSYAGMHPGLLDAVLARVGLAPAWVGVLNDAELAAASVARLPEAAVKTLVITLGFGIGAALLAAEPP